MSKVVELNELTETLGAYGAGYLLTGNPDGRVKVVSVPRSFAAGSFTFRAPGPGSCANAAGNPAVTVLFPPLAQPGFSLIVDGTATVSGEDLLVQPTSAILHRPA
jgi:hypothetical protein